MDIKRNITARRMGYGMDVTYSAIGLMVNGERQEFALVSDFAGTGKPAVVVHNGCDPDQPDVGGSSVEDFDDFDSAAKGYNEAFRDTIVGRRVRLVQDVDLFPTGIFKAGLTGTVSSIDGWLIGVKLDEHRAELDDWDNELQWHAEAYADADGRQCLTIEEFLADVEFIDGDITEVPGHDDSPPEPDRYRA